MTGDPDTLVHALAEGAARHPARRLFFDAERTLSYGETLSLVEGIAGGLERLGLGQGDRLTVLMPNGIDYLLVWLAAARAGIVAAYVNPGHLGEVLLHQLRLVDGRVALVDPRLQTTLAPALRQAGYATIVALNELERAPASSQMPASRDAMALYMTSGTTGPSKAVLYGHGQAVATAVPMAEMLSAEDVLFWFNPMFHVAVPHFIGASLIAGGSVAVAPVFSASRFWDQVRSFGATAVMMLGAVAPILARRDPQPDDCDHSLRKVFMVPLVDRLDAFEERFGIKVMSWFNMTELSTPLHTPGFNRVDDRSCGRPRRGVAVRLVDDNDQPVPAGQPGELALRYDKPWEGSHGYWGDPEATVRSWRNLWFHTGDVFTADAEGNYCFIDRKKDIIRRRGENISASEVESAVSAHPDVVESAAFAVPSSLGDDDVMVVAVVSQPNRLEPPDLLRYLRDRLARHMLPRYIRIQNQTLAKTPTGKLVKGPLRERGAVGSWDSEGATDA